MNGALETLLQYLSAELATLMKSGDNWQIREAITLYFVAVVALAAIVVIACPGSLLLAWAGKQQPSKIWAFAVIAVGGLVALVSGDTQRQG